MKNIHILPRKQPSRLAIQLDCKPEYNLQLSKIENNWTDNWKKQHIYITSDEYLQLGEKDLGCYYLDSKGNITQKNNIDWQITFLNDFKKKIVLTTDPALIADGVQAIDDDFLEWFVKNPCEFVDVKFFDNDCYGECGICDNSCGSYYVVNR